VPSSIWHKRWEPPWDNKVRTDAKLIQQGVLPQTGHLVRQGNTTRLERFCVSPKGEEMELILWRHAEAEPGEPDATRILTAKGHKQAGKMAEWLDRNLPDSCKILSSPATRTVQTAEALGRKFKTHPALFTDTTPQAALTALHWPDKRETVLVVGHQPTLGRIASLLIAGIEQDWIIRKGSIVWIAQKAPGEAESNYLKAVLGPDMACK